MSEPRRRMSGKERREQLIQISRTLFAEKGFDGTSVEEIAATANVSKPVVYEHFGGKEGVYAVVVDREMQKLLGMVTEALSASHSLIKLERAALALLAYVEENSEGFRILVRDSHAASGTGTFASLINDIASQVEDVMVDEFVERDYDPKLAPMYAQMLVGMVALTGQWWLDVRRPPREEVAAHLVNLAWNGLTGLNPQPRLTASSRGLEQRRTPLPPRPTDKELREMEKARERELKEQEKLREREVREAAKLEREREKLRLREQRELEKSNEREFRERERLLRDQEKARERELKEQEKIRVREAKTAEREAARQAEAAGHAGMEQEKLEPTE
ncbi:TetR/AcrR family transcriptional regulator [Streptosporangium lutulentum]|uniref:AcrR family transcriptional regulator n=1 Tax=Streptosporangium lutulentum TaxID=1461250 RepID=A0ABT9QQ46_9ACTN|nr:TetR/AcrR family transcriptional regulator [Streptosporangium lutulentum]MDP9848891.1 AcrR family transcriptional regulator [Streptosporangium lutulentum]